MLDVLTWAIGLGAVLLAIFFHTWFKWHQHTLKICSPAGIVISGPIPFVGCGLSFLRDPTVYLQQLCIQHGTDRPFVLEVFGFRLVFIFSPHGLHEFYRLREEDASFTEATRTLLGLKLPAETMAYGGMQQVRELMRPSLMRTYAATATRCCQQSWIGPLLNKAEGNQLRLDVFDSMRRLIHELGFRCWAGDEATDRYLDRLIAAFDRLDPEQAFVNPAGLLRTIVTRKVDEGRALGDIEAVVRSILTEREVRRAAGEPPTHVDDSLDALYELYKTQQVDAPFRRVAIDVFVLQVASLANLYSAISWLLINLAAHPDECRKIREQAADIQRQSPDEAFSTSPQLLARWTLVDDAVQESLRLAQKSITLRKVLNPVSIRMTDCSDASYQVLPGCYLSTLLSVTNLELRGQHNPASTFEPWHYEKNNILPELVQQPETVSTFGHGRHACPGRAFALMISKIILFQLLDATSNIHLDQQATWPPPVPQSQIGAVARTSTPVFLNGELKK